MTLLFNSLAIILVCGVLYVSHGRIAMVLGEPEIGFLILLGVGFVATKTLKETATMFFHGFNRMDLLALTGIVANVTLLGLVPGLVVLGFGLKGALIGYVLANLAAAVVGLGLIFSKFYTHSAGRDDDVVAEDKISIRILRYSVPLTFTMSANIINSRVDTLLLGVFRGPSAIAFYTVGKQISDFLVMPAHSLGVGVSPTYGEQKANDALERAAALYERSVTYTVTIYGPAVAGVVLVANPAVELVFGPEYSGAGPVLQIFSVFVFLRALDAITTDALDYLGRARARAIAKGISAFCNVVLNLLLIPGFGVVGAALATVMTYSAYVGLELVIIADELPIDGRQLFRTGLGVGGVTIGLATVVYPFTMYISDIPSLVGVIGLGCLTWAVLLAFSGVLDPREVYTLLE